MKPSALPALLLAAALARGISPVDLQAQSMRGFTTSRPVSGAPSPLRASLEFGAGRVTVRAGDDAVLYRMLLSYDAERFSPVQRFDQRTGMLDLGVASIGSGGIRVVSSDQLDQSARFEFSPAVPLILNASIGASDAELDLGGLALEEVTIRAGATRSVVDFSVPTTGTCREATFAAGAGELVIERLPQSGCPVVHLEGGIGRTVLDFSGKWSGNIRVEADVSIGSVALRIPRGIGLRISAERFLASMNADGMERTEEGWESPDFGLSERQIVLSIRASVAGVAVEWLD